MDGHAAAQGYDQALRTFPVMQQVSSPAPPTNNKEEETMIKPEELKFGTYGAIDLKPCKARTKLEKWCREYTKDTKPIKLIIEAEFDGGIQSGFDGVGQEFTICINKVKVKA